MYDRIHHRRMTISDQRPITLPIIYESMVYLVTSECSGCTWSPVSPLFATMTPAFSGTKLGGSACSFHDPSGLVQNVRNSGFSQDQMSSKSTLRDTVYRSNTQ